MRTRQRLDIGSSPFIASRSSGKKSAYHYPGLRMPDSLFAEFDRTIFSEINHRGYNQVVRQLRTLQNRLFDCTKFEILFVTVAPIFSSWSCRTNCFGNPRYPLGWGAWWQRTGGSLVLALRPIWHQTTREHQLRFLQRIAMAGTRLVNRTSNQFDEITLSMQDGVMVQKRR